MKRFCLSLLLAVLSVFTAISTLGCHRKSSITYNYENDEYIESISPTGIGRLSPIAISFVKYPEGSMEDAIKLDPPQRGTWEFDEDGKSAVFTPSVPYKANSQIVLSVDCGKLFDTGKEKDFYKHEFWVSTPSYELTFNEVVLNEQEDAYYVSGIVTTDIPVEEKEIASVLNAKLAKKNQKITWTQKAERTDWEFSLKTPRAEEKSKFLELTWSGIKLGLSKAQDKLFAGSKTIEIPAKSVFSILDINTSKPNTILVSFSKALDTAQDIASFIFAKDFDGRHFSSFNATIRGNVLTIFSDKSWTSVESMSIEKGIRSSDGIYLAKSSSVNLSERWDLPAVEFLKDNIILPTTQGSVLPIRTKNLAGVLIQVYEIFSQNMQQFLQVNELDETQAMQRVGEPVWEKKVELDWNDTMQNQWVSRGINLSELVKKYPDGMFHIRITFRKDQIKYECHANHGDFSSIPMPEDKITPYETPTENSCWDYWDSLNYEQRDTFWQYRNDPCHPAFYYPSYNEKNLISKNVLVSDLGILAKRDVNNSLYVTVADIRTAKPVPNAMVEIRTYAGRVISEQKTNSDGTVIFPDAEKSYIITAAANKQMSYLRIASGTSLSVSHFEIGGEKAENGVKGFIYGERGVWRPGDNLYLTFILQDLEKKLPANIPVIFELTDPLGKLVESRMLDESLNGFYPITTKTNPEAVTGQWTASVKIGGKTWTKSLKIETIVPNRLAIDFSTNRKVLLEDGNTFTIKGSWLHGAPTPNYAADVSVSFSESTTAFDGYSEFTFSNPSNHVDYSREMIWDGKLNSNSTATFTKSLDAGSHLPGKLKAHFTTRIFEPEGGVNAQSTTIPFSPYKGYVGIKLPKGDSARNMLLTDTDHTVDVVFLTEDGKPVDYRELQYKIYKLDWKWWWESDAYSDASYVSSDYADLIDSGEVSIKNGKGSFKFNIKYPSWGRYMVEVNDGYSGHSAAKIVYIDWPGWAGRAQESGSGSSAMVPLVADKKSYKTGETASIQFSSSKGACALVTIEKSGNIIKQDWIETADETTSYKLPLTENMTPNVYVHVTLLQPHMQTANSLPIRLYGVVPVNVENPKTNLKPVITSVDKMEPNKDATFSVSEAEGREMTYTIAVVDEGLLGLTNFHGQNPKSAFYKKEASQLASWDIYRYVMSAYSGKLETLVAIGGSDDAIDNTTRDQNRFAPVVKYFGPFKLEKGEKKSTTFKMPNYIGAVRAIVVAGSNGAYGVAEKTVPVKSDLMVQPSLPRTLGVNEKVNVPVTVFNGTASEKDISVSLVSTGSLTYTKTEQVHIEGNGRKTVNFVLETTSAGTASIEVTAKAGSIKASSAVPIDILSRGVPVRYKESFVVKAGKHENVKVTTPGEKSTTELKLELSTLPPIDLTNRLSYLIEYPHGCIEQITSGGFPQLYITDYVTLSPDKIAQVKNNVMSVIDRYTNYQTTSGAMGYWPGSNGPHEWGTCYASHFMLEAKNKGYTVPDSLLNPALDYIAEAAANWTETTDSNMSIDNSRNIQAYRLFVLALAGKANLGAMNRMNNKELESEARLLLAASYAQSGRKNNAKDVLKLFSRKRGVFRRLGGDFSSSVRESAMYLFSLTALEDSYADKIAKDIAGTLSKDSWLSTQETAWALMSILPYYSSQHEKDAAYTITSSGSSISGKLEKVSATETLVADKSASEQHVIVENKGKKALYGILTASGMSVPGTEKEQNEGLSMTVYGLRDVNASKVGDTVNISVEITNDSGMDLENLALTVPVATCFEFANDRVAGNYNSNATYTYQDIRDDAIYTYFDLKKNRTVTYKFTAAIPYSGEFYIPAIHAEAMYNNDIAAVKPGQRVKVLK